MNKKACAFRQLISIKCSVVDDLQGFFRKFDIITRSYKDAGETLAEIELIVIMLSCLPDEYGVVVTTLSTLPENQLTNDRARRCLLDEEMRRKNRDPPVVTAELGSPSAFEVNSRNRQHEQAKRT